MPAAPQMPRFSNPYQQRVADTRMKARQGIPNLSTYNVNFQNQSPTAQSAYYKGMQSGYGIPASDMQQEQQRYRLSGVSRGFNQRA